MSKVAGTGATSWTARHRTKAVRVKLTVIITIGLCSPPIVGTSRTVE